MSKAEFTGVHNVFSMNYSPCTLLCKRCSSICSFCTLLFQIVHLFMFILCTLGIINFFSVHNIFIHLFQCTLGMYEHTGALLCNKVHRKARRCFSIGIKLVSNSLTLTAAVLVSSTSFLSFAPLTSAGSRSNLSRFSRTAHSAIV